MGTSTIPPNQSIHNHLYRFRVAAEQIDTKVFVKAATESIDNLSPKQTVRTSYKSKVFFKAASESIDNLL